MARGTRADAKWHARPRGRATRAHAGSLGGPSGRERVARATRVHANARGGATWQEGGWHLKGPRVSGPWLRVWGSNANVLLITFIHNLNSEKSQ